MKLPESLERDSFNMAVKESDVDGSGKDFSGGPNSRRLVWAVSMPGNGRQSHRRPNGVS
jgi:hypothetical protein